MRRLALSLPFLLLAAPSLAQVCTNSVTLRQETCPTGTTCTTKGSTLTFAELDDNLANVAELCLGATAYLKDAFTTIEADAGTAHTASGADSVYFLGNPPISTSTTEIAGSKKVTIGLSSGQVGPEFLLTIGGAPAIDEALKYTEDGGLAYFYWDPDDDIPDAGDYTNLTAGRSLTAPSTGTIDADLELYRDTKCITVSSPTASDDWLFFRAESALTVTGIDCMVVGGTSVATLVKECNSNGGSCSNIEASITCATTNTTEASSIDNASVDAGDWIRVDPGTVTGAVTQLSVCVTFTWDD